MLSFLAVAAGVIVGQIIWIIIEKYRNKRAYQYKWKCLECNFTAEANTTDIIARVRKAHTHEENK